MNISTKTLNKALDIVGDKQIVSSGTIGGAQLAVLARQILLAAGGGLVTAGYVTNDQLSQIIGALIAIVTIAYGQYKARQHKAEQVVLADAAPEAVGTIEGPKSGR